MVGVQYSESSRTRVATCPTIHIPSSATSTTTTLLSIFSLLHPGERVKRLHDRLPVVAHPQQLVVLPLSGEDHFEVLVLQLAAILLRDRVHAP